MGRVRFKEATSGIALKFSLFPGNRVKVASVLSAFSATQVLVELEPVAEPDEFTVLDADSSGFSIEAFNLDSELTYNIKAALVAGEPFHNA